MNNRQYLLGYLADRPVINTHSHYHRTALPGQTDLACLLNNSYCSWVGGQLGADPAERKDVSGADAPIIPISFIGKKHAAAVSFYGAAVRGELGQLVRDGLPGGPV